MMKMNEKDPVFFCKSRASTLLKHSKIIHYQETDYAAMTEKRKIVLSLKEYNI